MQSWNTPTNKGSSGPVYSNTGQYTATYTQEAPPPEEGDRKPTWSNQVEFLFTALAFVVGFGEVWRFPYMVYKNGGVVFLIPYIMCMILIGIPLVCLEISLGQYSGTSIISVWNMAPLLKGFGIGLLVINILVSSYFNVIIAWVMHYLLHSWSSTLPWTSCDNAWNTERCFIKSLIVLNASKPMSRFGFSTPEQEYWTRNVLDMSSSPDDFGGIQWKIFGFLLFTCITIFLCLLAGIKSLGKVSYVTATLPYLLLLILLIRGLTLPGSSQGVKMLLIPNWRRILSIDMWEDAVVDFFYSMGVGTGVFITLSSYNRFKDRVFIGALLLPTLKVVSGLLLGVMIFAFTGFAAFESDVPFANMMTPGFGLVFMVMPTAFTKLPIASLWSTIFFLMLTFFGIGTQLAVIETISTGIIDEYPQVLKLFKRKWIFTGAICFAMLLLGFPFVSKAGAYYMQFVDSYVIAFSLMIFTVVEFVVILALYDVRRFAKDMSSMIGCRIHIIPIIVWTCVASVLILIVWVVSLVRKASSDELVIGDTYGTGGIVFGWFLALASVFPVPIYAVIVFFTSRVPMSMRLRTLFKPSENWNSKQQRYLRNAHLVQGHGMLPQGQVVYNVYSANTQF